MYKFSFLVNGSPENWAGIRAIEFAKSIETFSHPSIHYKTNNKAFSIIKFIKLILKEKPRFLYIMQPGYVNSPAGIAAKILFKTKIIIDVGDMAYEVTKTIGNRPLLELAFMKNMEKLLFRISDLIFVRGYYHKKYLNKLGYTNVYFVPDGIDTKIIKPFKEPTELRKKLGLEKYFTVGVMGTINWSPKLQLCYGWEIIETINLLDDLKVKGVIIGDGDGLIKLKEKAKGYGIYDKILFTGKVKYNNLAEYLSLIDVCISTQTNNIVGWLRTTGKLPIYLACNKYVLATKVGGATTILPEEMLIPYEGIKDNTYPTKLANKIRNLYASPQLLKIKEKGYLIAKKHFEYQSLAESVSNIIKTRFPVLRTK